MSQTANFSPLQLGVLVLAAVGFLLGIGVILLGAYFAHRLTYGSSSEEQNPSALLSSTPKARYRRKIMAGMPG